MTASVTTHHALTGFGTSQEAWIIKVKMRPHLQKQCALEVGGGGGKGVPTDMRRIVTYKTIVRDISAH